jgi:hypothetical protein
MKMVDVRDPGMMGKWQPAIWAMLLVGIATLALAIQRADKASFTPDESYSYLHYVHQSFGDILSHKEAFSNNHLLNTLGMKCAEQLFGNSELALRTPNLLALCLYLAYAVLLLRRLSWPIAVGGFVVLCTNVHVMEFFTLARGYGLSFAFLLVAQFHLAEGVRTHRAQHLVIFHAASVLASLSNFTLLTAHLAGCIAYYVARALQGRDEGKLHAGKMRLAVLNASLILVSVIVLWVPVQRLAQANTFAFHGTSSFYGSTVGTWVRSVTPGSPMSRAGLVAGQVLVTLLALAPLVIVVWKRKRIHPRIDAELTLLSTVSVTFLAICVGSALEHLLFGVDHLKARYALFLLPLLLLLVPLLLHFLGNVGYRSVSRAIMLGLVLWCVPTFLRHFGPYESVEWMHEVRTKDAMAAMVADHNAIPLTNDPVHVGNNWLFEPAMSYYREVWKLHWLAPIDRNGIAPHDAYRYVFQGDEEQRSDTGFTVLARFPESGTVLLKRLPNTPLGE